MADYEQMNGIALAYIGDAIYEVYVRKHLLDKGMTKPNKLHKERLTTFPQRHRQH